VEILKGRKEDGVEKGFHYVADASFIGGDMRRVAVTFVNPSDWSLGINEYERRTDGTWHLSAQVKGAPTLGQNGFEVNIKQGFNEPPMLVATHKEVSRVIWDPNPQLKNVEMGQADVYTWKDKEGRESSGVLYKPNHYKPGQRYPLVIQTHGLGESQSGFRPSGVYPTAFAARALAAAGIIVIQVDEHCPTLTPNEGPCAVSEYESAASQLVSEGVADPEKIGIIGFSRSCFYVMEALTTGSLHFKAASITDGVMEDYFQYLLDVGTGRDISPESDLTIGVKPFGAGLQQWLKRSPGFNLDKINSPLLVVGTTHPWSLLNMWAPYAGLRSLHKPVDLIILNTHEHVLTNPAARIASQGGSVDWFRFWLQNYEDPDPTKAAQYKRWRELRKLREKNEATLTGPKQ